MHIGKTITVPLPSEMHINIHFESIILTSNSNNIAEAEFLNSKQRYTMMYGM